MKIRHILFFAILIFWSTEGIGEEGIPPNAQGHIATCNYLVQVCNSNAREDTIYADVSISLQIHPSSGFIYIPLPFSQGQGFEFIVAPESSYNPILFGFSQPMGTWGLCQITNTNSHSKIHIIFKNASFPISKTGKDNQTRSIKILFRTTSEAIREAFPIGTIPYVEELRFQGLEIKGALPRYDSLSDSHETVLKATVSGLENEDIILLFNIPKNPYILYVFLSVMGMMLGYFASPRLAKSYRSGLFYFLISSVGIISLVIVFLTILIPDNKWRDTTTVVTIGMVFGLLIGILLGSVQIISRLSKENEPTK